MHKMYAAIVLLLLPLIACAQRPAIDREECVGPFSSWADLKKDFGAAGDGVADDTAAVQKALTTFWQKSRVLYIPAGTYRLTKGLQMAGVGNGMIIGEDPATTTIKWDGGDGEVMLMCNGVHHVRFSRLTWNGGGKKNISGVFHGWDGHSPGVGTNMEHSDEVFQDLALGIRAGVPHFMDAETTILRCRFIRCTEAGVRIQSFNALDWFIWDSEFDDCAVGITNDPGAGHFHAYRNIFRRSTIADIAVRNAGYFGIRHNLSLNSKRFFEGRDIGGWAVPMTIQGNTVIDSTDPVSILVNNPGPTVLLDNVIKSRADMKEGPAMRLEARTDSDYVAVGNVFTVEKPLVVGKGRFLELETKVVPASGIVTPELPGAVTPVNKRRQVFEVPAGATAAVIQALIDKSAEFKGKRPVVHFPAGTYTLDNTLAVPANLDVQFVGDSGQDATMLKWGGAAEGTLMTLAGPTRATFRDLALLGAGTGLLVTNADQPGARISGDGLEVVGGHGLLLNGLDQLDFSIRTFFHQGCKLSVRVVGGPLAAGGKPVPARTAFYGGASSGNDYSYDVASGGRLLVTDTWYEGAPPTYLKMNGSGTFTMSGAMIAPGRPGANAAPTDPLFAGVALENFRGRATFLSTVFGTRVVITGEGKGTNVLLMGVQPHEENMFAAPPANAVVGLFQSRRYARQEEGEPPTRQVPNLGNPDPQWVLQMLGQVRTDTPRRLTTLPAGVTDLRFYRCFIGQCTQDIRVEPK